MNFKRLMNFKQISVDSFFDQVEQQQQIQLDRKSIQDFLNSFLVFFKVVNPSPYGPWIAGGFFRRLIDGESLETFANNSMNDVDFFFYDAIQYAEFVEYLKGFGIEEIYNSAWATTLLVNYAEKSFRFQLIKPTYQHVYKFLEHFDYSVCKIASDGFEIILDNNALADIKNKRLIMSQTFCNDIMAYRKSISARKILQRYTKYVKNGYTPDDQTIRKICSIIAETNKNTNHDDMNDPNYQIFQ